MEEITKMDKLVAITATIALIIMWIGNIFYCLTVIKQKINTLTSIYRSPDISKIGFEVLKCSVLCGFHSLLTIYAIKFVWTLDIIILSFVGFGFFAYYFTLAVMKA